MRNTWIKRCLFVAMAVLMLTTAYGCTTNPTRTETPMPTMSPTMQATVMATTMPAPASSEMPGAAAGTLTITVDGKALTEKGMRKNDMTWLPLEPVAKALGFVVERNQSGTTVSELTISQPGSNASAVKVTYQSSGAEVSNVKVSKVGTDLTLTDPLMMEGTMLYASEKLFTEALDAKVTTDEAGNSVTVTKGTMNTTAP